MAQRDPENTQHSLHASPDALPGAAGDAEKPNHLAPRTLLLLACIVALGAAFRLYDLGAKSLWYDEAYIVHTGEIADSVLDLFDPETFTDPPLFSLLVDGWHAAIDRLFHFPPTSEASDFALRLLPCLLSILAIPLLFAVAFILTGSAKSALASAYILAISPFHIYYAQELRTYALYPFLSLLAIYCLHKALEENRLRHWVGLVVALSSVIYAHYIGVWVIFCVDVYFVLMLPKYYRHFWRWVIAQSAVLLLILPMLFLAVTIAGYFENIDFAWYVKPNWKTALITFKTFFAWYSPRVALYWLLFGLASALSALGIAALRKRLHAAVLLLILVALPIGINIAVWSLREFSMYEHRLFIFSGIMACVLVGAGIGWLPKAWMSLGVLALFTLASWPCIQDQYAQRLHPVEMHRIGMWDKVDLRGAAQYVNSHLEPGDVVGHPGPFALFSFTHYSPAEQCIVGFSKSNRDQMLNTFGCPEIPRNHGMMPKPIQELADTAKRIWFVEPRGIVTNWPPNVFCLREWLEENTFREDYRLFDGVTLACYRTAPDDHRSARGRIMDRGGAILPCYRGPDGQLAPGQHMLDVLSTLRAGPAHDFEVRLGLAEVQGASLVLEDGTSCEATWNAGQSSAGFSLKGDGPPLGPASIVELDGLSYSVLDIDAQQKRALLAAFPLQSSEETFTYQVIVENLAEVQRTLQCTVMETEAMLSPLDYAREDPYTSAWNTYLQHNISPPPESFWRPMLTVRLEKQEGVGDLLQAPLDLAPGRFRAFARIHANPAGQPGGRGQASFTFGNASEPFARVDGLAPAGKGGWMWFDLGSFEATGDEMLLSVSPHNAGEYRDAYVEMDRTAFVREPAAPGNTPFITSQFELTLEPRERKVLTLQGGLRNGPRTRVDIDVLEGCSGQVRTITFDVLRANTPESAEPGEATASDSARVVE